MTRKTFFVTVLALITAAAVFAGNGVNNSEPARTNDSGVILDGIEVGTLDSAEHQGLLLMREEEKLARDVYEYLNDTWNVRVFGNIAQAEQTHMDSVALLFDRYDIDDPVTIDDPGVFENEELRSLYAELIATGETSVVDAMKVGALIEELDITDLQTLIAETDNEDLALVYGNLLKGSENHLRAFLSQLDKYGVSYEPQYLSEREIDEITAQTGSRGWQSRG